MLPIIAPISSHALDADLAQLPESARILTHKDYEVWLASAEKIPSILQEIGRLREISFRAAGEGTGQPIDLDHFDTYYQHLFIWHKERHAVIGAYRLGFSGDIMPEHGLNGFYTYQLFDYTPAFIEQLQPCIELGRSFIRVEDQRNFVPLLLLWRGISTTAYLNPQYRRLFGPVSISADIPSLLRQLLAETLLKLHGEPELSAHIKARNPLPDRHFCPDMLAGITHSKELESILQANMPDVRMPVLLRQYLNLNGRLLSFSLDPQFSNTLDGLVLVDLDRVDQQTLSRYMGSQAAHDFLKKVDIDSYKPHAA